ncbi:tetratricopeptide repeat protein [Tessaracoccus caeni]|uniref:tetratricopeptide repeat protein n=1 Tax=Tessaracoccus caeni TaxID=3031239 RepID=UPI0023DA21A2|nr:tetratricopeptide repeat protein [Tessaracoccus caeni]MDF1488664.1 tetratricopeptide repeat protein [Tessaracoccus caeni]
MSKVSSIVSAAVPWVLGVFGVPPLVAEGAGVVAAGVDTVVEAGKASAARNRELQAFVAKAAESFEEQCGREITHLGDYDREVVEKRMRELLQAADRDAMLGAALIGYDEFQLRLFGTEACAGLDDDGRGYLVALCGHVHGLVLSFAQSDAVLGVASTTAIRIIWRELASRPTLDQVQLLIRQAISGEVEKRRHVVGSRPRLAAGFVTRNEMPALRDALDQSGVATVSALQGMRGAGKSQLASAYAEACENDLWRFVGWITASTREQAITELAAAAQSTGISDEEIPEKAARQLLAWLSSAGPEPRLLVFDNVNSADDVTDLIPTGPGMRVIVTTTRKATALGKPVEIGVYTPQQAIDYLQDATDVRDEEGAGAVAEDLGRLPVALTQAAVVIKGRNYDFRRYRELLSSGRGLDRVVETEDGAYPQLVGVALRLAYTDVLKGLPGEVSDAAEHVLGALALLAEPGVPREWLRGLGDDEFVVDETVGALVKNSILIESEDRRIVSLHRLQAQVIREDFEARNEMGAAVRNACVAMHGASWYVANTYLVERDNNREIASQFVAVREQSHSTSLMNDEDWMRLVAAVVYRSSQQLDPYPAIELEGYLEDVNRVLGADCREALMFCNNLGVVYELVGDLGRARLFYERALDGLSKVTGADQSDVLAARNNLAGVYLSSGNLTQAASMLERVVCDAKRVFGERHPDTLMFRGNLAKAYEAVGDLSRASVLFDRLTEDTSRILGSGDQRTFTARSGLARAYKEQG